MNQPLFHYMGNKAGTTADTGQRDKVVEATKNSEFYKRQEEKREMYSEKVQKMLVQLEKYRNSPDLQAESKKIVSELKLVPPIDRIWAHFDFDMFYIACELLDRPELVDKPCAVGGEQILSTANYVARKFGVRSAMPTFVARKLCPELIVLPHHFEKYKAKSNIFMGILRSLDPHLESMGLDEANLDLTEYLGLNQIQDMDTFISAIRQRIFEETKLTISCGVGPNKMIAKLASEVKKPNGQHIVENQVQAVQDFLKPLPLRKIPGIGMVTEQILSGLDFKTCEDIRNRADELHVVMTQKTFEFLVYSAWGCARNVHAQEEDQQSISCSRTFQTLETQQEMLIKIDEIADYLAADLKEQDVVGNHLTLTLKSAKFEVRNKSLQLQNYTNDAQYIAQNAKQILKSIWPVDPIRLLGLKMQSLQQSSYLEKHSIQQYIKQSDSSQSENISKPKQFVCPICDQEVNCLGNNISMNNHIDKCLGMQSKQQLEISQPVTKAKKKATKGTLDFMIKSKPK